MYDRRRSDGNKSMRSEVRRNWLSFWDLGVCLFRERIPSLNELDMLRDVYSSTRQVKTNVSTLRERVSKENTGQLFSLHLVFCVGFEPRKTHASENTQLHIVRLASEELRVRTLVTQDWCWQPVYQVDISSESLSPILHWDRSLMK